jgi:hemerythrin
MGASIPGWSEELATGINEIDAQHRTLLAKIAALEQAGHDGNLRRALDTMEFLPGYVSNHFTAEEGLMLSAGYAGLDEHRALHEAFVREYVRRKTEFEANRSLVSLLLGLSDWLNAWLNAWLHEHIRGADTQMANYLRSTRSTPRP